MYLFEKAKAYAYVMQWAEAALFAVDAEGQNLVRRVGRQLLHKYARLTTMQQKTLKQEVLSRLFHACVQSANFRDAYAALSRYQDNGL